MSDFSDRPQFQPPSFEPPRPPAPPSPSNWGAPSPSGPPTEPMASGPPTEPMASGPPTVPMPALPMEAVPPSTPIEVGEQPQPRRRRSKGIIIGAAVAVVALVGAGVFALTQINSNDDKGGAASSVEAGQDLVAALNDEDILGVVDLLLPGERDTFRQPLIDLVDNLKRMKVLGDGADPNKVDGLDIDLTDVQVTADDPVADDIDTINISATNNSTVNGEAIPLGDILVKNVFGGARPTDSSASSSSAPAAASPVNLGLTTVEKDGRWYLSLFYTIAEGVRQDAAPDQPVPDQGVALAGADEPELAVDQMAKALTQLDLPTMIGGLNPNEAEALQRYAPLFLDEADTRAKDMDVAVTYGDAQYTVTGSGDHRHVTIPSFTLTVQADGQSADVTVKDGCAVVTSADRTVNSCESGKDITKALGDAGLGDDASPEVKDLVTTVQHAFADFSGTGIAVDQVGGKWYVSPIATGFDALNAVLGALDSTELQDIIDAAKKIDTGSIQLPDISTSSGDSTVDTVPSSDETVPSTQDSVPTAATSGDTFPDLGAPTADDFRAQTEDFIDSSPEIADQIGSALGQAECETPSSTAVGTTYTCVARDDSGTKFTLEVEITEVDGFTVQSAEPA